MRGRNSNCNSKTYLLFDQNHPEIVVFLVCILSRATGNSLPPLVCSSLPGTVYHFVGLSFPTWGCLYLPRTVSLPGTVFPLLGLPFSFWDYFSLHGIVLLFLKLSFSRGLSFYCQDYFLPGTVFLFLGLSFFSWDSLSIPRTVFHANLKTCLPQSIYSSQYFQLPGFHMQFLAVLRDNVRFLWHCIEQINS